MRYVHSYRDPQGRRRHYFRRRGYASVALPGAPGSPEFMLAYNAALAGCVVRTVGKERSAPGSVSAGIAAYYTSHAFLGLAQGTRAMRRAILERFRAEHGDKRLAAMERQHVTTIIAARKPFAARNWLKALRGLMLFAVEIDLRRDDPTADLKLAKARAGRIHSWTEAEIAQFEATHAVGTRPRLAMGLLLYTGQRRSDVVRLGPQHMRGGLISVRQQKTGTALEIPVHPALASIIEASACGHLAFLVTTHGAPFSAAGFGNSFREWCDAAGLPQCSAHGLRKAQCRRLAEAGCSAPMIAAISGHKSLREVQRYIEAAEQVKLARAAMRQVEQMETKAVDRDSPTVDNIRKS